MKGISHLFPFIQQFIQNLRISGRSAVQQYNSSRMNPFRQFCNSFLPLCISGTHGKTTTTSMATHIFMAAQKDPTVMIGGTLQLLHSGYRVGKGDTIIAESCEYCNSFLSFFPTVAVILNVEADHLDFFKDLADVEHSFRRFA